MAQDARYERTKTRRAVGVYVPKTVECASWSGNMGC